ncbi:MAG: hypothetical protein HZB39_01160 [Planctomycetes bacterium]|nr:hypothetical protein [Planctomycetota bacterium]
MSLARSALLAALLVLPALAQDKPARQADVAGMRDAQIGAIVVGAHAPGPAIAAVVESLGRLLPEREVGEMRGAFAEAPDEIGFDLLSREDWLAHGLDPDGDYSLRFAEPGGWIRLPQETLMTLAVHDAGKLDAWFVAQFAKQARAGAPIRHVNPTYATFGATGWSLFGARCLVLARSGLEPEVFDARMAERVASFGSGEMIGTTKVYRAVRNRLSAPAIASCYLRPADWLEPDAEKRPPGALVELLAAIDSDGIVGAAEIAPELLAELTARSTVDVVALASRLPAPDALVVANVADPMRALRRFAAAELAFGGTSIRFDELAPRAPRDGELLAAGAAAWLPARDGTDNVEMLVFLRAIDEPTAKAVLARLTDGMTVTAVGENLQAYSHENGADVTFIARRGELVLLGNSPEKVFAALEGKEERTTGLTGDAPIEGWLELEAVAGRFHPALKDSGLLKGRLLLRGEVDGAHAIVTLRHTGAGIHEPFPAELVALLTFLRIG